MKRSFFPLSSLFVFVACVSVAPAPPAAPVAPRAAAHDELLDATLWVQTAAEYRALVLQSYQTAARMIDAALTDPSWTAAVEQTGDFSKLPPAIILDVDETILDNSAFEARLLEKNLPYDETLWNQWVDEAAAPAIPGAVELTNYAAQNGVTVFYVTNRNVSVEPQTRRNLMKAGFPMRDGVDTVLTAGERDGWVADKASRRKFVADQYRVLLLFGDDLGDFDSGFRSSVADRYAIVEKYKANWGTKWIPIPDPMYGSWEHSILGFMRDLSEADQLRMKRDALRTEGNK
jgi:Predicted secreted acid phosphatase